MIPDFLQMAVEDASMRLPGWQPAARCLAHVELILKVNPARVVEIGVYGGRSLIPQAMALKHLGNGGKIYGIDPWHRETAIAGVAPGQEADWRTKDFDGIHTDFMHAVETYRVRDEVVPIRARSDQAHSLFAPGSIDILHIDGSHAEQDAVADVVRYILRMRAGGHVWFDDSDFASTQKAISYLDSHAELVRDYEYFRLYRVP